MKTLILAALPLFPMARPAEARLTPELAKRVKHGLDAIYRMEFDDCEKTFQEILKDHPGLPYAYFGLAATSWARFEYEEEESNIARHHEFEARIEDAIAKGKAWLKANPQDAEGMVCVGGMYGMRSRLALMLHSWIRAYWDGTKAVKLTENALQLNPQLYDVYTGLGMWDYYTDTLPSVIKILGRIVAIRGNARRGIDRLNLAAEKGMLTATAAKLILIELQQDRLGPVYNPANGLKMIREIRQEFPMNPLFQFVEVIYLYEGKKAKEAVAEAQDMVKGVREGRRFYHPRFGPRAWVGLAHAHFLSRDWAKAEEALTQAVEQLEKDKGHNRWGLWGLIRRGQLRDVKGDRKGAIGDYRRALEHLDYWQLHQFAKVHLKKAATEAELLGPIPPP